MRTLIKIVTAFALGSAALCGASPKAVLVLHTEGSVPAGVAGFLQEFGADSFRIVITGERNAAAEIPGASVLFMEHPTADFLAQLRPIAEAQMKRGMKVLTDVPPLLERGWGVLPDPVINNRVLSYFQLGGAENIRALLQVLYQAAGGSIAMRIPPPVERPAMGVYHPHARRLFSNLTEYLAWYRKAMPSQGKLAIVTFFQSAVRDQELSVADALLGSLEKQGLAAAGVFGWPTSAIDPVLTVPAGEQVRINLSFTLALSKPEDATALEKRGVPVMGLMTSNQSYEEWAKSDRGVTPERLPSSIASPERNGAIAPITVATEEPDPRTGIYHHAPIAERVEMAARRARRWVALQEKANKDKRLAILYYNNPPGKGNIGASYLNLPPSIRAVLKKLEDDGYNLGGQLPTTETLLAQLERSGRNIELWAPGELDRLVNAGGATLIPMVTYRKWFDALPKQFRDFVNARWGQPEASKLMTVTERDGRKLFVIPGIRLGNIFLGPQLLRASTEEITSAQHSGALPPHHAYIASYLYYRHQFDADAVIHMGRHGTLEWLPGKNAGQAAWDSSEVLLGDLPNLNYYIMDGGGEELQARRRGLAVDISHLTPMLAAAGNQQRFSVLQKALDNWVSTHETSPALAEQYREEVWAEARRLHLDKQLSLAPGDAAMEDLSHFLDASEEAPIPLGLPTLGQMPSDDRQREGLLMLFRSAFTEGDLRAVEPQLPGFASQILAGASPVLPDSLKEPLRTKVAKALKEASVWLCDLRRSPDRELTVLTDVLNGRFPPSGLAGDPLRTPAALPSGSNLHETDPATYPTKEAWTVGKKMANELIAKFRSSHAGAYPERTSMVLWSGETGRHQGVMEAEALYLMGVAPEWNQRGAVDRVTLIPDAELGRPRVDVVFTASGLYRDALADKILLLDRAARLAAAAGDNAISRQNRAVEAQLLARSVAAGDAAHLAGARVFSEAPGAYGTGLSNMVELNGDKDQAQAMAEMYLAKTNFVFTEARQKKSWVDSGSGSLPSE